MYVTISILTSLPLSIFFVKLGGRSAVGTAAGARNVPGITRGEPEDFFLADDTHLLACPRQAASQDAAARPFPVGDGRE